VGHDVRIFNTSTFNQKLALDGVGKTERSEEPPGERDEKKIPRFFDPRHYMAIPHRVSTVWLTRHKQTIEA
jgi:hypothetical protein